MFGVDSDTKLAAAMGVKRQSLHRIGENQPLPNGRQWQIRALIAEGKIPA